MPRRRACQPIFIGASLLCLFVGLLACADGSEGASVAPVMRIVGPAQPALFFASSIANAGDFNGDGFEDLAVGGPSESVPSHARVYFGGPGADSIEDVVLLRDPLLLIVFHTPVASAGDMNGDGIGDVVVSTPTSTSDEGQARVYFGGRTPNGIPDLRLREAPRNEGLTPLVFKPSVAAADFNGDGFDDLLLGSPGANEDDYGDPLGRAYLFLGSAVPDGNADLFLESPSTFTLGDWFYGFGGALAAAGDLNGDRFEDFLVGPHHPNNHPPYTKAFVYLGGTKIDSIPDGSMTTMPQSTMFGQGPVMTAAGDLNGDGLNDVAVVGPMFPPSGMGVTTQLVQIYFGKNEMSFGAIPDLTLDVQGGSVAGGRDVNGDGHSDLIVGSGFRATAYIYLGGVGFDAVPDIVLTGERSNTWFGAGVALADWTADGVADIAVTAPYIRNGVPPHVFIYDVAEPLRARAFTADDRRTIAISAAAPAPLRVRFEPVDGSYASGDVDPQTIQLRSVGTGGVSEIAAIAGKVNFEGDHDGNGVPDLLASFSGADLARLFSNVVGRQIVDVTLEGRLRSRRRFAAPLSLTIVGTGPRGDLTAAVRPNPLNPRGTLAFRTASRGAVTARLFDLHGRCVRILLQGQSLEAGGHQIPIDGRDDAGRDLASGVYFYRIDSADGAARGRLVVAK